MGARANAGVPALRRALNYHATDVRTAAVQALEQIGTRDGIAALTEALKNPDYYVQLEARSALERLERRAH